MQYLFSVVADSTALATDDEMTAIDAFNERLEADGHWVFAGGLEDPATGAWTYWAGPPPGRSVPVTVLGLPSVPRPVGVT